MSQVGHFESEGLQHYWQPFSKGTHLLVLRQSGSEIKFLLQSVTLGKSDGSYLEGANR